LALNGLKESLDQPAWLWLAWRTVKLGNGELPTCDLQRFGMINLAIVRIELDAGAVAGPRPQKRIDQTASVFIEIVTPGKNVSAMRIDPRRKPRLPNHGVNKDDWPVFEISLPERIGQFSRPSATDFLFGSSKPFAGSAMDPKMAVDG